MKVRPGIRPILMVEDSPMDIDLTVQALTDTPMPNPVVVCRDGEEALQYMERHGMAPGPGLPILVLLDLRLPMSAGFEVLRFARMHPVWKMIPIVVLSSSRQDSDIEAAYAAGANSYIVKPVDPDKYVKMIRRIRHYWLRTNEGPFGDL